MITESEYLKAKAIVEEYEATVTTVSAERVKLSPFGIEMQQPKDKNKTGVILRRSLAGLYDYCVEVKWDNSTKAEWMHESQVEPVKQKKGSSL
jgi:hypothetical protein